MSKVFSVRTLTAIVCFTAALTFAATTALFAFVIIPKREGATAGYNNKLAEIDALVKEYYIGEYDSVKISDGLSYGFTVGLEDKYAGYVTAENADESLDSLMGYNSGMGVLIVQHPDTGYIYVTEVHKDSPAEKAGIKQKDQIIELDGQKVSDVGYSQAVDYIKTVPNGDKIKAVILREGNELSVEIELMQFVTQTVFFQKIKNNGYIHIASFNDKTVEQFIEAVDALTAQNVDSLIFDVRGNGGGTLTSVYHMVDYLVPEGLIVKVDYKDDRNDQIYMSNANEVNLPMVVLTDENTASASELFTQSLIDYGKAISVGRKTYGKGVVQRTFTLSDQSLIRFTVAKYYTKSGICVDGVGVAPNISVEWTEDELSHRIINGIESDKEYLKAVEYLTSQLS